MLVVAHLQISVGGCSSSSSSTDLAIVGKFDVCVDTSFAISFASFGHQEDDTVLDLDSMSATSTQKQSRGYLPGLDLRQFQSVPRHV